MDIFYFYLIQCLKHKEKIEKRRENLYIPFFKEKYLENAARAMENGIFSYITILESNVGDSQSSGSIE
jgi:hypothetical protein